MANHQLFTFPVLTFSAYFAVLKHSIEHAPQSNFASQEKLFHPLKQTVSHVKQIVSARETVSLDTSLSKLMHL